MVFRKVLCKSNGAVEVFIRYFIGNVCVNAAAWSISALAAAREVLNTNASSSAKSVSSMKIL